ncbi:MAG: YceI family protein [Lysobacterales bacterium]
MARLTVRSLAVAACATIALLATGQAAAESWRSTGDANDLVFATAYDGQPLEGRFRQFEVRVETEDRVEAMPATLAVSVDVASADMNDRDLNETLASPDWFDSAANRAASFTSDTIEQDAANHFVAAGTLELKGVSAPATVDFSWSADDDRAKLSGTAQLSRSTWSIGEGEWAGEDHIPDTVKLRFTVNLAPRN